VQSVYVVPELRDGGIGAALQEAVLAEAGRLELEHVTVHSSRRCARPATPARCRPARRNTLPLPSSATGGWEERMAPV
jgi:hypothetical protein